MLTQRLDPHRALVDALDQSARGLDLKQRAVLDTQIIRQRRGNGVRERLPRLGHVLMKRIPESIGDSAGQLRQALPPIAE